MPDVKPGTGETAVNDAKSPPLGGTCYGGSEAGQRGRKLGGVVGAARQGGQGRPLREGTCELRRDEEQ